MVFNPSREEKGDVTEGHAPSDRDRTLEELCQGKPCKSSLLE